MGTGVACNGGTLNDMSAAASSGRVRGNPSTSAKSIGVALGDSENGIVNDSVSGCLAPDTDASAEVESTSIESRSPSKGNFKDACASVTRKDCFDGERLKENIDL